MGWFIIALAPPSVALLLRRAALRGRKGEARAWAAVLAASCMAMMLAFFFAEEYLHVVQWRTAGGVGAALSPTGTVGLAAGVSALALAGARAGIELLRHRSPQAADQARKRFALPAMIAVPCALVHAGFRVAPPSAGGWAFVALFALGVASGLQLVRVVSRHRGELGPLGRALEELELRRARSELAMAARAVGGDGRRPGLDRCLRAEIHAGALRADALMGRSLGRGAAWFFFLAVALHVGLVVAR